MVTRNRQLGEIIYATCRSRAFMAGPTKFQVRAQTRSTTITLSINRSLERYLDVVSSDYKWLGFGPLSSPLRITCASSRHLSCPRFITLPRFPMVSTGNPTAMSLLLSSAWLIQCLSYSPELMFDTEQFLNPSQRAVSLPNHMGTSLSTPSPMLPPFRIYPLRVPLFTRKSYLARMRKMGPFL